MTEIIRSVPVLARTAALQLSMAGLVVFRNLNLLCKFGDVIVAYMMIYS